MCFGLCNEMAGDLAFPAFLLWGTKNMSDPKFDAARARLETLWAAGKDFLGTDYAIMAGAMSWVSERHLVSAVSNAGGFG